MLAEGLDRSQRNGRTLIRKTQVTEEQAIPTHYFALLELGLGDETLQQDTRNALKAYACSYLFAKTSEADLAPTGPVLIRVNRTNTQQGALLQRWAPLNALAYIASPMELHGLAEHLRSRLSVVLPNKEVRVFRFYETYVLSVLFNELDAEQHRAFWDGITEWHAMEDGTTLSFLTRESKPVPHGNTGIDAIPAPSENAAPGHFRLSQRVWDKLRFESDMQGIRQGLRADYRFAWFAKAGKQEQDALFLELVFTPVKASGLIGMDDLTTASLLAMSHSDVDVFQVPEVQAALRASAGKEGYFASHLPSNLEELLD